MPREVRKTKRPVGPGAWVKFSRMGSTAAMLFVVILLLVLRRWIRCWLWRALLLRGRHIALLHLLRRSRTRNLTLLNLLRWRSRPLLRLWRLALLVLLRVGARSFSPHRRSALVILRRRIGTRIIVCRRCAVFLRVAARRWRWRLPILLPAWWIVATVAGVTGIAGALGRRIAIGTQLVAGCWRRA